MSIPRITFRFSKDSKGSPASVPIIISARDFPEVERVRRFLDQLEYEPVDGEEADRMRDALLDDENGSDRTGLSAYEWAGDFFVLLLDRHVPRDLWADARRHAFEEVGTGD